MLKLCRGIFLSKFSYAASKGLCGNMSRLDRWHAGRIRDNPIILKMKSKEFYAIFTKELNILRGLFAKNGFELRIAGGAVRDLLLGIAPEDIDLATTATPDEMKEMFEREKIRVINTKGEKHGTITARINDLQNFEITTLRIDSATDGRRATVEWTKDWMLDASRRDLTINSMYLGLDGTVYDYFYGYEDLLDRKVTFVGDPDQTIQEDYLRILRYFRFYGRVCEEPNKHDPILLETIERNMVGLERISGERIWSELKKIVHGKFSWDIIQTMIRVGMAKYIGLPVKPNLDEFGKLRSRVKHLEKLHPISIMVSLLHSDCDVARMHDRLKFSSFERDMAFFIVEHRSAKAQSSKPLLPFKQLVFKNKNSAATTRLFVLELLKYNNSPYLAEFEKWEPPKFPITGEHLKNAGVPSGRIMGFVMDELKVLWMNSEFSMNPNDLLAYVPQALQKYKESKEKKRE